MWLSVSTTFHDMFLWQMTAALRVLNICFLLILLSLTQTTANTAPLDQEENVKQLIIAIIEMLKQGDSLDCIANRISPFFQDHGERAQLIKIIDAQYKLLQKKRRWKTFWFTAKIAVAILLSACCLYLFFEKRSGIPGRADPRKINLTSPSKSPAAPPQPCNNPATVPEHQTTAASLDMSQPVEMVALDASLAQSIQDQHLQAQALGMLTP